MRSRWTACLIAICMVFSVFGNGITLFGAEKKVIKIYGAQDLIGLAKNCRLDTWSQGRTVQLMNDIDLSGSEFKGIPIFGGEFNGNNYTLSGLSIEGKGEAQGLFRYVEEGGIVKNLTVKGNISTSGTKKTLGGIAGENAGTIKNCSFIGNVNGESYIGGIAGINEAGGKIIGSVAQGVVTGTHYIGGIAGENLGTILNSINKAKVNNTASEVDVTLESLEKLNVQHLNSSENITSTTDIGGITGFSTGIIQGCENHGIIGYQHMGYNIGGIVGRQSGYVNDCLNFTQVYGRKDVGGIAGQVEPYVTLQFSEDKLGSLQDELSKLQRLMNKAISDASSYSDDVSVQLGSTKTYVDSAIDSTSSLVKQTQSLYNDTIGSVNDLSARASSSLKDLVPILDKARTMGSHIETAIEQLRDAVSCLEVTSEKGQKTLDRLQDVLDELQDNGEDYIKAMETISEAMDDLNDSVGDRREMEEALDELSDGFKNLADSLAKMSSGMNEFKEAMEQLKNWTKTNEDWNNLVSGLDEVSKALQEVSAAAGQVIGAIGDLLKAMDQGDIASALNNLQAASAKMASAVSHLEKALGAINSDNIIDSDIETVLEELKAGSSDLQESMKDVDAALGDLQKAVSNEESKAALEKLKAGIRELQDALTKLSEASEKINKALEGIKDSNENGELAKIRKKAADALKKMNAALGQTAESLSQIQKAVSKIDDQIDFKKLESAADLLEQSVDELTAAAKNTDKAMEGVKKVTDSLQDTAKSLDEATSKIKEALDTLHGVSVEGSEIVEDIYDVIANLADKPAITFPNIDSGYMQTTDNLTSSLSNVSGALGTLNDIVSKNNDIMIADLQAVSDQFYVVMNLLIDATTQKDDLGDNLEDYHEDISDQDTANNTQGKVAQCTNEGEIQGDVNVGGITGSMSIEYDFDPEDDVTKKGNSSLKFQYLTRAVIRACVNKGSIISKKNYAGGIAGRMDLGSVINCMGYGKITSTDGDFVGGVAGASYTHIQDSFAMCILSGGKNIGGIAGYGTKLTRNYAMVEVDDYSESVGAIAGSVEEVGSQTENYFVDRGIGAIDEISYTGKAAPVSYEEFIQAPGMPKEFTSLALTFTADGQRVGEIPFKFGESIDENKLPQIPEKAGYYGSWPEFDYKSLTFSATLEAVYTPYTAVVESTAKEEDQAVALIKGSFGADAVLTVVELAAARPKAASAKAKILEVTISGADAGISSQDQANIATDNPYELRLLVGKKGRNTIYVRDDKGIWKKVNAKKNGSYAVVDMNSTSQIFCIDHTSYMKQAIIAAGCIIVIGGSILIKLKKKAKGRKHKAEAEM